MMIKCGARNLFSSFLTSKYGNVLLKGKIGSLPECNTSIDTTINSLSANTLHIRRLPNFPWSLKRPVHSLSESDDDFSELGSPVAQITYTLPKLMTEKPEHYRKNDANGKASSSTYLRAGSRCSSKDTILKPKTQKILEGSNDVSTSEFNNKSACNFDALRSITIKNVPPGITLSQMKETVSTFGNISSTSMRMKERDVRCCDIEFESSKSRKRAISAGKITVKSFNLPIGPLHIQETFTIRICNISAETSDSKLKSMCMSYGPLEGIIRTENDEVHASFNVKDSSDIQKLLKKLNYTIINKCKWSAVMHPNDTSEVPATNNGVSECKSKEQMDRHLDELKRKLSMKKIYLEDLKNLHDCLVHLEGYNDNANKCDIVD